MHISRSDNITSYIPLGGCECTLQNGLPSFCDGEQARNVSASDAPSVTITYSVLNKEQFIVIASVKNLNGTTKTRHP